MSEYELTVDTYEQARERPRDNKEQEKYYSGKKSNHTFKSQMIILPDGSDIVDVVVGEPGPKSDITLFRENRFCFDPRQRFKGDKADRGELLVTTPLKKPRNRELTSEQKQQNQEFSAKRILVEHRIREAARCGGSPRCSDCRSVKIFRVAQERFRLNPQKYKQVMRTICGLVRLQIGALILRAEISANT